MNWKLIRIIDEYAGIPLIRMLKLMKPSKNSGEMHPLAARPERILLIKFWGIGNLFMLLPSVKAIRTMWPDAEIDFLTLESSREALITTGMVNSITTIDTGTLFAFILSWHRAVRHLINKQYDLIVDFEQFARFSAFVACQINARRTIGFNTCNQHRHYLYTDPVLYDNDIHVTRSFYSLVEQAGVTCPFTPTSELTNLEVLRTAGQNILSRSGIPPESVVVVMHIGTSENFCERRWPPKYFAALADRLAEQYGMHIILTGLPDESHLVQETWQCLKSVNMVRNLGGQLSFSDYFSLIAVSDLVISADTAAVHLASALNTPIVGLYGPNTPHLYGPWGGGGLALYEDFDCSPCITNFNSKLNICRHPRGGGACMRELSVEKVFSAIDMKYCIPSAPYRLTKLAGAVT